MKGRSGCAAPPVAIKSLGDVLTKARAGPCIYWTSLSEEDIQEKGDKIQKLVAVSLNLET